MKNGENFVLRNDKYVGGGLNDGFIIIKLLIEVDKGIYLCRVINVVGLELKNVMLGILLFVKKFVKEVVN